MTAPADPPGSAVAAPIIDPSHRNPEHVEPADDYRFEQAVWVHPPMSQAWHPGLVEGSSPLAVIVRYLPEQGRGQLVDTVAPDCVMVRKEHVPDLDPPLAKPPHDPGS